MLHCSHSSGEGECQTSTMYFRRFKCCSESYLVLNWKPTTRTFQLKKQIQRCFKWIHSTNDFFVSCLVARSSFFLIVAGLESIVPERWRRTSLRQTDERQVLGAWKIQWLSADLRRQPRRWWTNGTCKPTTPNWPQCSATQLQSWV